MKAIRRIIECGMALLQEMGTVDIGQLIDCRE